MSDNHTLAYIIFGIVLLHVIGGFIWVIFKFMKKKETQNDKKEENT
jgi:heme/copper-type cytochrome/quinol oxidase subunit 2